MPPGLGGGKTTVQAVNVYQEEAPAFCDVGLAGNILANLNRMFDSAGNSMLRCSYVDLPSPLRKMWQARLP